MQEICIVLYVILLFVVSNRKKTSNDVDFFTAGKNSSWPAVAFGMVGATISGISLVSVPGMVIGNSFFYMQMVLGFILGYMVVAFFLLPLYYKLGSISIYSYLENRFGVKSRQTVSALFLINKMLSSAVKLYVVMLVLHRFIFEKYGISFEIATLIVVGVIFAYTFRNGVKSVVLTDCIQTACLIIVTIVLLVEAFSAVNGNFTDVFEYEDMHYPLHLGVTEAGEGEDGRIKSAVGIGALLTEGIGDTIRVSLSEEPECEIPVARKLVDMIEECAALRAEAEASIKDDTVTLSLDAPDWETLQLKAAMAVGALFIDKKAHKLSIINYQFSIEKLTELSDAILQAARIKFTKTEYISCPGCGRTLYNLQETIAKIKAATKDLVGLKIGIMGCIVNGPGEMADADYGYVGAGRGKISLYKAKECVEKNIPEAEAVEKLLELIRKDRQG